MLVHGGVLGGRETWRAQRPLTERWTLLAPDRPGHGQSPPARQDFEPESVLIADQLPAEPTHLAGLSYGAIVSMYAAARRPENVLSLTIVEPPAAGVARGVPVVDEFAAATRGDRVDRPGPVDGAAPVLPRRGRAVEVPDPPPEVLAKGMPQLLGARPPDEAEPPLHVLRDAPFRVLVVSGGHSEANEIICDTIARETGGERAVRTGADHLVPEAPGFNDVLERFLRG